MRSVPSALLACALAAASCGRRLVPVIPDGTPTGGTSPIDPTFEIVARINGIRDPLPVVNANVAFAGLERSLGQAVVREVAPRHDSVLTVELVAGDADYRDPRLSVSLVARATLRTRVGNTFVAQTEVVCRDGAIVTPESGGHVIWSCMTRLGHDLGGWLADLH